MTESDGIDVSAKAKSKKRVVLHCGAPKTGSTSLQWFIDDHKDALRTDGAVCPGRFVVRSDVDPIHRAFVAMRHRGNPAQAIAAAQDRLAELFARDDIHTVLISNESMLGEPFVDGKDAFFPIFERSLDQLKDVFRDYDVHVIYFIRDFASFLPSYYVQDVRRGGSRSFAQFCADIDFTTLNWRDRVAALKAAFGDDRVMVVEHAALRRDGKGTFERSFGQYFPSLPPFKEQAYDKNRSIGGPVLQIYRLMNWLFARLVPARVAKRGRRFMRQVIFAPLGRLAGPRRFRADTVVAEEMHQKYEADRAALGLCGNQPKTSGKSE